MDDTKPYEFRGLLGPTGCLEAWGTNANKKNTCSGRDWFVGLAAEGGKAKKPYVLEKVWMFGLCIPGLQKITWPKKHFGILLKMLDNILRIRGKRWWRALGGAAAIFVFRCPTYHLQFEYVFTGLACGQPASLGSA